MKVIAFFALLVTSFSSFAAGWQTTYDTDEMRGMARKFVETKSENSVDFDFPYNGGSKLTLVLRSKKTELKNGQKAEDLPMSEAIIMISKGQFACSSFDDCHVSVKFDDDKINKFSMSEASRGISDVIFFDDSTSFIKKLAAHKKLIIEASFYQSANKQFKFDISGLSAPKPKN